jgi:hypothetical protein
MNLMMDITWSQILRDAELTVTNFHDLLCLLCSDFQLRVVKSAFKAAWVVLRGEPNLQPAGLAAIICFRKRASCCAAGVMVTVRVYRDGADRAHEHAAVKLITRE